MPRDDGGVYLRNPDGQVEVHWTEDTEVALQVNTCQFRNLRDGVLEYAVHSSRQTIHFPLPDGPVTGIKAAKALAGP